MTARQSAAALLLSGVSIPHVTFLDQHSCLPVYRDSYRSFTPGSPAAKHIKHGYRGINIMGDIPTHGLPKACIRVIGVPCMYGVALNYT